MRVNLRPSYYTTKSLRGFRRHIVMRSQAVRTGESSRITFVHTVEARRFTRRGADRRMLKARRKSLEVSW